MKEDILQAAINWHKKREEQKQLMEIM